jgi:methyl-accepting chemotaxis protein
MKLLGVLDNHKKSSRISDMIKDVHYKTGSTFIISSSYATIAHSRQDKASESNQSKDGLSNTVSAEIKKLIEEQNGVGSYEDNGVTKYIAYAKVEGTSWYLAIDVPEADVTEQVSSLISGLIYIGIAGLILGMFISVFIARNIKKPIHKLVEVSEYYARGRFDIDINLRRKDGLQVAASAGSLCHMHILISISVRSKQVASAQNRFNMMFFRGSGRAGKLAEELSSPIEEIYSDKAESREYAENANNISSEGTRRKGIAQQSDETLSLADGG